MQKYNIFRRKKTFSENIFRKTISKVFRFGKLLLYLHSIKLSKNENS